jgi:nucleotide-binding universal stress UspA family protein
MSIYTKILVGVDGSDHSLKALATGVSMAKQFGAELFVFHSVRHHYNLPVFPLAPAMGMQSPMMYNSVNEDSLREMYQESGRQILDQARQAVEEQDPEFAESVTYILETELAPHEYVESFVKENGVDLVIVGCYGHHSGVKHLTGTVATRILNTAPCQVLVVR